MSGYGDDTDFSDWAADNGYTIPGGAVVANLRQRGSVYLDALYGARFVGWPTDGINQDRAWPRTGAYVYGTLVPSDVIPTAVIHASYEAAMYEANNPGGLQSSGGSQQVKRAKAGPVEVEYVVSETFSASIGALSHLEGMLAGFLRSYSDPVALVV